MDKIFTLIRAFIADFLTPDVTDNPLDQMSPRELADLPVHHPRS
jgi:hypothetical protein